MGTIGTSMFSSSLFMDQSVNMDHLKQFGLSGQARFNHSNSIQSIPFSMSESAVSAALDSRSFNKSKTFRESNQSKSKADTTISSTTPAKPLKKTDMILLQKETEKLARTAFAKISRDRPSSADENKVVLEWCMGSISILLRVMPISAVKCLNRRIKDYARHGGSEVKDPSA